MDRMRQDENLLVLYEDLMRAVVSGKKQLMAKDEILLSSFIKRLEGLKEKLEFERRLIEDVSLPARLILEHFSYFLDETDDILQFSYGNITSGHGRLHQMKINDWATICLVIGDSEITWRDSEVHYLFYPDKVTIRSKESLKDADINLHFKHSFNHASHLLRLFQAVEHDKKTAYWHEKLKLV